MERSVDARSLVKYPHHTRLILVLDDNGKKRPIYPRTVMACMHQCRIEEQRIITEEIQNVCVVDDTHRLN